MTCDMSHRRGGRVTPDGHGAGRRDWRVRSVRTVSQWRALHQQRHLTPYTLHLTTYNLQERQYRTCMYQPSRVNVISLIYFCLVFTSKILLGELGFETPSVSSYILLQTLKIFGLLWKAILAV